MSKYRIESKAGVVYGTYEGDTPEQAFAAMVADAGAADAVDADGTPTAGTLSDWIIKPAILLRGRAIDMTAARNLMDDELCEAIHGTVDTEQEFLDAYLVAHQAKYGEPFVFA